MSESKIPKTYCMDDIIDLAVNTGFLSKWSAHDYVFGIGAQPENAKTRAKQFAYLRDLCTRALIEYQVMHQCLLSYNDTHNFITEELPLHELQEIVRTGGKGTEHNKYKAFLNNYGRDE